MAIATIDQERLSELQQILGRLDPTRAKAWRLEVYNRVDGADKLYQVIDLQTGKTLKARKKENAQTIQP